VVRAEYHTPSGRPGDGDSQSPELGLKRNARIRREGTANLVGAVRAAGAKRLIAQSIAWTYAPKESRFAKLTRWISTLEVPAQSPSATASFHLRAPFWIKASS
jgi:hypothetical protein